MALENFFKHFKDRRMPDELYGMDMEDFKIIRKRDGVAERTINFEIGVVRAFYNWLINTHDVPTFNPAGKVKALRVPENPRRALSRDAIAAFLTAAESAKDQRENLLVRLVLTTGMRRMELAGLKWSWIDLEHQMIYLPADAVKNWHGREIPLRSDIVELLKNAPKVGKDGFVFKGWQAPDAITWHWKKVAKQAGQPKVGIHQARRAYATYMHRAGADLRTVQALLGHRNITTTAMYLSPADTVETRKLLDALPV